MTPFASFHCHSVLLSLFCSSGFFSVTDSVRFGVSDIMIIGGKGGGGGGCVGHNTEAGCMKQVMYSGN